MVIITCRRSAHDLGEELSEELADEPYVFLAKAVVLQSTHDEYSTRYRCEVGE